MPTSTTATEIATTIAWIEAHLAGGTAVLLTHVPDHMAHALAALIALHTQQGRYRARCTVRLTDAAGSACLHCVPGRRP